MESREEKSKAFTRRTVIWGAVAYIAMALNMAVPGGADLGWFLFLTLPSFVAGVAVAAVKGDGGLVIPVSECQVYDLNQVGGDFQMDSINGVALSARAQGAAWTAMEASRNDYTL